MFSLEAFWYRRAGETGYFLHETCLANLLQHKKVKYLNHAQPATKLPCENINAQILSSSKLNNVLEANILLII